MYLKNGEKQSESNLLSKRRKPSKFNVAGKGLGLFRSYLRFYFQLGFNPEGTYTQYDYHAINLYLTVEIYVYK